MWKNTPAHHDLPEWIERAVRVAAALIFTANFGHPCLGLCSVNYRPLTPSCYCLSHFLLICVYLDAMTPFPPGSSILKSCRPSKGLLRDRFSSNIGKRLLSIHYEEPRLWYYIQYTYNLEETAGKGLLPPIRNQYLRHLVEHPTPIRSRWLVWTEEDSEAYECSKKKPAHCFLVKIKVDLDD